MNENLKNLLNILSNSIGNENFIDIAYEIIEELGDKTYSFDAVEPILRLIESNPDKDFGTPGPLVHFMEKFYGKGYEEKLISSIERYPTKHTVWMLNRIINGSDGDTKQFYIGVLDRILKFSNLTEDVKTLVQRFRALHV